MGARCLLEGDEMFRIFDDDCIILNYTKNTYVVHFKGVNIMACELYLNEAVIKNKIEIYFRRL